MSHEYKLVANLECICRPITSLYMDDSDQFYILTRSEYYDGENDRYLMTKVSPQEIIDYIDHKTCLRSLYTHKPYQVVIIKGNDIIEDDYKLYKNTMIKSCKMEDEFCPNQIKIKIFVSRFKK